MIAPASTSIGATVGDEGGIAGPGAKRKYGHSTSSFGDGTTIVSDRRVRRIARIFKSRTTEARKIAGAAAAVVGDRAVTRVRRKMEARLAARSSVDPWVVNERRMVSSRVVIKSDSALIVVHKDRVARARLVIKLFARASGIVVVEGRVTRGRGVAKVDDVPDHCVVSQSSCARTIGEKYGGPVVAAI